MSNGDLIRSRYFVGNDGLEYGWLPINDGGCAVSASFFSLHAESNVVIVDVLEDKRSHREIRVS